MTVDDFPITAPARPLWLITLADLALLLVGFFVLLQANQNLDKRALASGFRQGFGGAAKDTAPEPQSESMPVAAAAMLDFAPGSATLPSTPDAIVAWAREAAKDPRVRLTVTGASDGSAADVDPDTGSAAVLAADRARAVAAALAAVAPGRLVIVNAARPGRRHVVVTLDFAGEPK
ncbi:flagellar motor protein MotB [Sphingomonas sp. SUN019]|uniref:flagellar motor protein MotB n=1 Tax=Sphingomonas sp. SUN019 TaxID=2937788 RepID=UPI0021643B7E|nr:flagellar motor protein MotB [Sphingomonas sp. SUN019]UVO51234.1 flagellar motor protein MotB [Sphingomonas sp. SUN019]